MTSIQSNKDQSCCNKVGEFFIINERMNNLVGKFLKLGVEFLETGKIENIGKLMVIAHEIKSHEHWNEIREDLLKKDYHNQVPVLEFFATGYCTGKYDIKFEDEELYGN